MKRICMLGAVALAGCGLERPTPTPNPPDVRPERPDVGQPDEIPVPDIGDPEIARASCEPGPGASSFEMVAAAAHPDVVLGDCGELAWNESGTGALFFAGRDEPARQVDEGGGVHWLEGHRLLYGRGGDVVLEETGEAPRIWAVGGAAYAAAIPGTDAFWICAAERGIERLDADGVTSLTPDFITMEYASGCGAIDVAPTGTIAYPTSDNTIGLVETATGTRETIDLRFYPYGTIDDEELGRTDFIRFGPDASFVLHEKRWFEAAGDAVGPVGAGELTIATSVAPASERIPGMLVDTWAFGESSAATKRLGPWMGSAPRVLVPARDGVRLVGGGATRTLGDVRPRRMRGNHVFAETASGAAVVDLGRGRLHQLFPAPTLDQVFAYRWGGPVAFSHRTGDCIRYPDRTETCHTQLWAVTLWDQARGPRRVAYGTQPLSIEAVGPAGQLIVEGHLLDGPPPARAEPRAIERRLVVLDAAGDTVGTLDGGQSIDAAVGGAHFALLERSRVDDTTRSSELVRIDWATGEEQVLVAGWRLAGWALDHSDRRVTALVHPERETRHPQIWSGVVLPAADAR